MVSPLRRIRQAVTLVRNLWFLRRELLDLRRRRRRPAQVVELRCLRCRRPLTKPCRPKTRAHVIRCPDDFDARFAGKTYYVRQTKPGRPADVRTEPF